MSGSGQVTGTRLRPLVDGPSGPRLVGVLTSIVGAIGRPGISAGRNLAVPPCRTQINEWTRKMWWKRGQKECYDEGSILNFLDFFPARLGSELWQGG